MTVEVRRMAEKDISSYHRCLDAVARERRHLALQSAPPIEQSRAWVLPLIREGNPVFVAVAGSEVVGWCDITPRQGAWFAHRGSLGMGVQTQFRRQGIGRRLLDAALAGARERGLERVELEVFASNLAATRLYERAGFVVEGTLHRAAKAEWGYDDVVLMALELTAHVA